jgi:rare lipoprotein A
MKAKLQALNADTENMKKIVIFIVFGTVFGTFCFAQAAGGQGSLIFRQQGIASWYGSEFDGRPTASGEIFDSSKFTAAHPSLPFGTILTVTNTQNNRQVTVRVNDRGPFVAARIIDLSRAAAETLDMLVTGTAPVSVESIPAAISGAASGEASLAPQVPQEALVPEDTLAAVENTPQPFTAAQTAEIQPPDTVQPAEPQTPLPVLTEQAAPRQPAAVSQPAEIMGGIPPAGSGKSYRLQIGAYRIPKNAVEAFDKLKNAGLNPAYERNNDLYRVVLAGLKPEDIPSIADRLGAAGFHEALIREER